MLIMRIHRAAGELREAKWLQWCDDAAVEGGVRGDAAVLAALKFALKKQKEV